MIGDVMEGQVSLFDLDGSSGRMSPELYQAQAAPEKEKTSEQYWKMWQGSSTQKSQFLDLRKESGRPQDASPWTAGASLGGSWTPSGGECLRGDEGYALSQILMATLLQRSSSIPLNSSEMPNEPNKTKLSEILEPVVDGKYHLSAKACQGILTRAARRGKPLPEILRMALESVVRSKSDADQMGGQRSFDPEGAFSDHIHEPDSDSFLEDRNVGKLRKSMSGL